MEVALLVWTPEPLCTLWTAVRTCKSSKGPTELWSEYPGDTPALRLLCRVWKAGHQSVFEHVALTFAVEGVSRVLLAQYTRHRIGVSISVQSARGVQYSSELRPFTMCDGVVNTCVDRAVRCAFDTYDELIRQGIHKEDARYVLPQGSAVNFVTTLNLRSLWDVYQKRVATPGAQAEIKEMVGAMMREAIRVLPWLEGLYGFAPLP